jgi:hypothetical protein
VDKSRRSNRSSETTDGRGGGRGFGGLALALLTACAAPYAACVPPAVPVTALELPDASRAPDGVVVEPIAAVPLPEEHATADGVVALRAPLGGDAVVTVVHRLFRAFAHEDVEALQAVLTEDAVALGDAQAARNAAGTGSASGIAGAPSPLLDQWRTRLKNPAYARLAGPAGGDLVDADHVTRFTYEDLGAAGAPARPAAMKAGELLVHFTIATPRIGAERLFGDAMTLLLRRDGRTYKIAGMGEENAP